MEGWNVSRPSGSLGLFSSSLTCSAGEKNAEGSFPNALWVSGRINTSHPFLLSEGEGGVVN